MRHLAWVAFWAGWMARASLSWVTGEEPLLALAAALAAGVTLVLAGAMIRDLEGRS